MSTLLLVGLGNPGREYETTRHNAGFILLDAVADLGEAGEWRLEKDFRSEVRKLQISGRQVLFVKPQTYMNASGDAVQAVAHYYKVEPKDIIVLHDELDLPLGKAQIRWGGGIAGHNGLSSIAQKLGTTDFGRVRIGIRGQELRQYHTETGIETSSFVLGRFSDDELGLLARFNSLIAAEIETRIIQNQSRETQSITAEEYKNSLDQKNP